MKFFIYSYVAVAYEYMMNVPLVSLSFTMFEQTGDNISAYRRTYDVKSSTIYANIVLLFVSLLFCSRISAAHGSNESSVFLKR